jgi:hypothetical protein
MALPRADGIQHGIGDSSAGGTQAAAGAGEPVAPRGVRVEKDHADARASALDDVGVVHLLAHDRLQHTKPLLSGEDSAGVAESPHAEERGLDQPIVGR